MSAEPTYEYAVEFAPGMEREEIGAVLARLGLVYEREGAYGFHIVSDPQRRPPGRVLRRLQHLPEVLIAEENLRMVVLAKSPSSVWPDHWTLSEIRAPEAWQKISQDGISTEVVVAVIDTGFDFAELDFDGLWVAGMDFTTDQHVGDEYGPGSSTSDSSDDHGTAVARVIVTVTGRSGEDDGVSIPVKLMPLRVFWLDGVDKLVSSLDVIAKAVEFAVQAEVNVINLSLGDENSALVACSSAQFRAAIDHAWSEGVVLVAAAGNTGALGIACPALLPSTIAVGAFDAGSGGKAAYSSFGPQLDLVAPGVGCSKPQIRACLNGTSFAAPRVSAVVAMMLSAGFPQDPEKIRAVLHMTAIRPDNRPGRDDELGYGRLDALGAVSAGIPRIMLLEVEPDEADPAGMASQSPGLEWPRARMSTEAGFGGHYQLAGVEEGRWIVAGWVDVDGDGILSIGDYYGESEPLYLRAGESLAGVDLVLIPYEGVS